jgi:hypothetical protein
MDLLLADDSTKHALGKVNHVIVELHTTFVPTDFVIMGMGSKTSSPIILGRPFLSSNHSGYHIDAKYRNVKFQFPHKKCTTHCRRKKVMPPRYKLPHDIRSS